MATALFQPKHSQHKLKILVTNWVQLPRQAAL
jgi:hypothetical protein